MPRLSQAAWVWLVGLLVIVLLAAGCTSTDQDHEPPEGQGPEAGHGPSGWADLHLAFDTPGPRHRPPGRVGGLDVGAVWVTGEGVLSCRGQVGVPGVGWPVGWMGYLFDVKPSVVV
jgi:hypothetical protein